MKNSIVELTGNEVSYITGGNDLLVAGIILFVSFSIGYTYKEIMEASVNDSGSIKKTIGAMKLIGLVILGPIGASMCAVKISNTLAGFTKGS